MDLIVKPSKAKGEIKIPSSKSVLHRALICASMATGITVLSNTSLSEDVLATISILESLGVDLAIEEEEITIYGKGMPLNNETKFDVKSSGSTLRFLLPFMLKDKKEIEISAKHDLLKRKIGSYEDLVDIKVQDDKFIVKGFLERDFYLLNEEVSSQTISGLLLFAPLLNKDVKICSTKNIPSTGYVELTIKIMSDFGVKVHKCKNGFLIKKGSFYKPCNMLVEGDYSHAANFFVAGAIGGDVYIDGLFKKSYQPDKNFTKLVKSKGNIYDLSNNPDLVPPLSLLLCFKDKESQIINIDRLAFKESNRIKSVIEGLNNIGGNLKYENGILKIKPIKIFKGGVVNSYNDHRIIMMASIASFRSSGEIKILHADGIIKSYPKFFDDFKSIGGIVEVLDETY